MLKLNGIPDYRINFFSNEINKIIQDFIKDIKESKCMQSYFQSSQSSMNQVNENNVALNNQFNQEEVKQSHSDSSANFNRISDPEISSYLPPLPLTAMNRISSPKRKEQINSIDSNLYSRIEEECKFERNQIMQQLLEEINEYKERIQKLEEYAKKIKSIALAGNKQGVNPISSVDSKISESEIPSNSSYYLSNNNESSSQINSKPNLISMNSGKIPLNQNYGTPLREGSEEYKLNSPKNSHIHNKMQPKREDDLVSDKNSNNDETEIKEQQIGENLNIQVQRQENEFKKSRQSHGIKRIMKRNKPDHDVANKDIQEREERKEDFNRKFNIENNQERPNLNNGQISKKKSDKRNSKIINYEKIAKISHINDSIPTNKKANQQNLQMKDKDICTDSLEERVHKQNNYNVQKLFSDNSIHLITENHLQGIDRIKSLTVVILNFIFIQKKDCSQLSEANNQLKRMITNYKNIEKVNNFDAEIQKMFGSGSNSLKILIYVAQTLKLMNLAYILQELYTVHDDQNLELLTHYYLSALKEGDFQSFRNYILGGAESLHRDFEDLCIRLDGSNVAKVSDLVSDSST